MKQFALLLLLLSLAIPAIGQAGTKEVVAGMVEQVKKSVETDDDYGFKQELVVTKLKDGKVDQKESRIYKTTWIDGHPYSELILINNQRLTPKQKSDEIQRKQTFVKCLKKGEDRDSLIGDLKAVRWWEIADKYDFTMLEASEDAAFVLAFRHKQDPLQERNRVEKILNHLAGKIWLDADYNVLKAETWLNEPVKFAWGIFKLDEMKAFFKQREMGEGYLPSALHLVFKAHAGFFRKEHQDITAQWIDVFQKPGSERSSATSAQAKKK